MTGINKLVSETGERMHTRRAVEVTVTRCEKHNHTFLQICDPCDNYVWVQVVEMYVSVLLLLSGPP